jgi:hypothetical protein
MISSAMLNTSPTINAEAIEPQTTDNPICSIALKPV